MEDARSLAVMGHEHCRGDGVYRGGYSGYSRQKSTDCRSQKSALLSKEKSERSYVEKAGLNRTVTRGGHGTDLSRE